MKKFALIIFPVVLCMLLSGSTSAQKAVKRLGRVCGDPRAVCKVESTFAPNELPFDTGRNGVIADSEKFYAVVISSVKIGEGVDCEAILPEADRLKIQEMFPKNKVFVDRCGDPGSNYYKGFAVSVGVMAIFAGRTRAEAVKFLAAVKATGKFNDAYLKWTQAGINGT